jgi:uncharacterized protein (TIGR04222 family)
MSVFDLPGPEFLKFYLLLLAVCVAGSVAFRFLIRTPAEELRGTTPRTLGALEVAYLAGGARAVTDAAVAALLHREVIRVEAPPVGPSRLVAAYPMPVDATPTEVAAYSAIAGAGKDGATLSQVRRTARETAETVATPLRKLQLIVDDAQGVALRAAPALLMGLCLLIGLLKVNVGISRHRPVEFLVMLCIATAGLLLCFVIKIPHRTRRGDKLLAALKQHNAALEVTTPRHMAPADLALAMALFGPTVLSGVHDDLYSAFRQANASGGSSCGGSSCGSSGGCGGGGCGGGGCGGCGS